MVLRGNGSKARRKQNKPDLVPKLSFDFNRLPVKRIVLLPFGLIFLTFISSCHVTGLSQKRQFKSHNLPSLSDALSRTPAGELTFYDMSAVTIGNLPWYGEDCVAKYRPGIDPPFRSGLPWFSDQSSPDNVIQDTNGIKLICRKEAGDKKEGVIYSNFTIKYGTVQVLARFPDVEGAWSAIWLFAGLPEYDFEHCGQWDEMVTATAHWGFDYSGLYGKKSTLHNERQNKTFRPAKDYYLYEIYVSPYKIVWYINGMKTREMKRGISSHDQHLIISVGKGEYCGSDPKGELTKDAKLFVKWVKVFKMAD